MRSLYRSVLLALCAGMTCAADRDPLDIDELRQVCSTALRDIDRQLVTLCASDSLSASSSVPLTIPATTPSPTGRPADSSSARWQPLLIERRQSEKTTSARYADVYVYDYANDQLNHLIVNAASGALESREILVGVQLPLSAGELLEVRRIAFADAALRGELEREFQALFGTPLTSLDQVNIKAFIFDASSLPGRVNAAAQRCGVQRCAQLSIDKDGLAFETQPIISLSTGRVVQQRLTP